MTKGPNRKIVSLCIIMVLSLIFTGCSVPTIGQSDAVSNVDASKLPVYPMDASFVYDTNNIYEAVGICDYVFVGEVVSCDGTQYRNTVTMEDENGNPKEVGSPYTIYTVNVVENIKGALVTDQPIQIAKQGGVSQDQDAIYIFENDELPAADGTYIFLAYAQENGSLLVSGPNSNIPLNVANAYSLTSASEYEEYQEAVENEIIPVERERFTSSYEAPSP